jgi:hypothetical protein
MRHLDLRTALTHYLGWKQWIVPETEIERMAGQLRNHPAYQAPV